MLSPCTWSVLFRQRTLLSKRHTVQFPWKVFRLLFVSLDKLRFSCDVGRGRCIVEGSFMVSWSSVFGSNTMEQARGQERQCGDGSFCRTPGTCCRQRYGERYTCCRVPNVSMYLAHWDSLNDYVCTKFIGIAYRGSYMVYLRIFSV